MLLHLFPSFSNAKPQSWFITCPLNFHRPQSHPGASTAIHLGAAGRKLSLKDDGRLDGNGGCKSEGEQRRQQCPLHHYNTSGNNSQGRLGPPKVHNPSSSQDQRPLCCPPRN